MGVLILFTLLIVDDEEMIRDGIAKGIQWKELGFEVIGEACNGLEAIEAIKLRIPDVVITDIRMHDMDGIELMEYLSENYPSIKLIVLSGYNDFDYLKSSIRSNVFDYLLKPTLIPEFIDIFKKLKIVIEDEKKKEKEYESLKKSLIENLPYLEHIFLNQLVLGFYQNKSEIEEKMKFYKIDLLDRNLAVVILEIDNIQSLIKEISEEELQLLKIYIIDTAYKIMREMMSSQFFIGTDGCIVGICYLGSGMKKLISGLNDIQEFVYQSKKLYISAGISNIFEGLIGINTYLNQAKQAIRQKLYLGYQSVVLYSDIENVCEENIPIINFDLDYLIDLIFEEKTEEISNYILNSLSCLKNNIYKSLDFVDSSILKLLFELNGYFIQHGLSIDDLLLEQNCGFQEVCLIDTLEQKARWLTDVLMKITQKVNLSRNDNVTRLITEVTRYLEKNYLSNSICLESLAEQFEKSPPYLSKLFKEETGENFTNYLTRLRMERAKELLRDVKIKVYEVPNLVGYADVSHFSRKFKAYTGLSPSRFRNECI